MSGVLLANSLSIAVLTAVLATGVGAAAALAVLGMGRRLRGGMLVLGIVALAMPPFLATSSWIRWFGLTGVGQAGVAAGIPQLSGAVIILVLLYWPIAFFLLSGAWSRVEIAQLEAEPAARGWVLIRRLLVPMGLPAALLAAIVVLVLALNNFAVPALLQVRVYPADVWIQFNTHLDAGGAFRSSWPMVAGPMLLLVLMAMWRLDIPWPALDGPVRPQSFRRQCGRQWFFICAGIAGAGLVLSVVVPLRDLILSERTWSEMGPAVRAGRGAIINSLMLSAVSATVVVVVGMGIWRWRGGFWLWLPFLVPGILLGVLLIIALNRPPFLAFYRGLGIVVFAFAIRYGVLGWAGARHAMRSVDQDLVEAGRVDGASGWDLMRHVMWPQLGPRLGATWLVVYLLCLWDVETLLLIAPPGAESVAGRVFGLLHYGHNAQVNALCLVLLVLAVLPLVGYQGARLMRRILRGGLRGRSWSWGGMAILSAGLSGCGVGGTDGAARESRLFERVEVIGSRGAGLGQFHKPRSVAVDREDNVYVVDMTGRVQKFSSEGQYLAYWQFPVNDLGQPKGMCRDEAGNIVILEPHYSRVNHFTTSGQLVEQWGVAGRQRGELSFPRAVAVREDGDVLVSEYGVVERIQHFRGRDRALVTVMDGSTPGALPFNRPEGLALDQGQRLYVADSCNHRIQVYDALGRFVRAHGRAGQGLGEFSYPYDIQVDAAGRQYVCEFGNSRIQVLDAADRPIEVLGGPGSAPGQLNNPWAIALDSQGNLYVADSMNHRVQKWVVRAGSVP
jgi:ABC-type Fe3+ transport system permease subunit